MANKKVSSLQVIELDKADIQPLGTQKECRAAILSLDSHMGFQELLRRFRLAKQLLRSQLETAEHTDLVQVQRLQALLSAYGFFEKQLKLETGRPVEQPREAYADENAEFQRLMKFVEIVGREKGAEN